MRLINVNSVISPTSKKLSKISKLWENMSDKSKNELLI